MPFNTRNSWSSWVLTTRPSPLAELTASAARLMQLPTQYRSKPVPRTPMVATVVRKLTLRGRAFAMRPVTVRTTPLRIEVEKIDISDVIVLADFSDRAEACGKVAADLRERFGARVSVRFLLHPAEHAHEGDARARMERIGGGERRIVEGDPVAHLREICEEEKPSLILAPAPLHLREEAGDDLALGTFVDTLLVATAIPTLLIRGPADGAIFDRILAASLEPLEHGECIRRAFAGVDLAAFERELCGHIRDLAEQIR